MTSTSERKSCSSRALNPQQKEFLRLYMETGNLKDSYYAAGYTGQWEKTAHALRARIEPHIKKAEARKEAIEYRATDKAMVRIVENTRTLLEKPEFEAAVNARTITKEWIINELIDNVVVAKRGYPVISKTTGEPIRDESGKILRGKPDLGAANTSLQLLGKEMGMFGDGDKTPDEHKYRDIEELKERVRQRSLMLGLPIPGVCQRVEDKS